MSNSNMVSALPQQQIHFLNHVHATQEGGHVQQEPHFSKDAPLPFQQQQLQQSDGYCVSGFQENGDEVAFPDHQLVLPSKEFVGSDSNNTLSDQQQEDRHFSNDATVPPFQQQESDGGEVGLNGYCVSGFQEERQVAFPDHHGNSNNTLSAELCEMLSAPTDKWDVDFLWNNVIQP